MKMKMKKFLSLILALVMAFLLWSPVARSRAVTHPVVCSG